MVLPDTLRFLYDSCACLMPFTQTQLRLKQCVRWHQLAQIIWRNLRLPSGSTILLSPDCTLWIHSNGRVVDDRSSLLTAFGFANKWKNSPGRRRGQEGEFEGDMRPSQLWACPPQGLYLSLQIIRPLERSYGESSIVTLSPGRIRIKFIRSFPLMCANTTCLFSSSTLNIALGSCIEDW